MCFKACLLKNFFVFPFHTFFPSFHTTNTIVVPPHTQGTTDIFNVYLLLFPKLSSCEKRRNIMDESHYYSMTFVSKSARSSNCYIKNVSIQIVYRGLCLTSCQGGSRTRHLSSQCRIRNTAAYIHTGFYVPLINLFDFSIAFYGTAAPRRRKKKN